MGDVSLDKFFSFVASFFETADAHTVIVILILTFVVLRSVWVPRGYSYATLSLLSLFISCLITPLISTAEEMAWGGRYYWNAVLRNGTVAVVLWHIVMPQVFRRWPELLRGDEMLERAIHTKEVVTTTTTGEAGAQVVEVATQEKVVVMNSKNVEVAKSGDVPKTPDAPKTSTE